MRVIGLLGGVASGKSLVADQLAALGATVIDADRAAHEVLQLPEVKKAVVERWGNDVIDSDGRVDRAAVGKIVFAPAPHGPAQREFLEQLTHPRIGEQLQRQFLELGQNPETRFVVLDVPLLLEAGWDKACERIVFVDAPHEQRLARAIDRGWSEADFIAREGAQPSLDKKRARADSVVDNSGSIAETQDQIRRLWQQWSEEARSQESSPLTDDSTR